MLYIPFLNLPTPHYSTTCPFTGVHTSTLVADVRSVSQVDSALLGIDSPSCWDKKNDANESYKCTVYTRINKKKLTKKWCLTLGKSTFGQPKKLRVGRWFSFFLLRWFFGVPCSFFVVYKCGKPRARNDDCILGLGHIQCAILNRST